MSRGIKFPLEVKVEARRLRSEGRSFPEICKILNVSKSTLSLWLHDLPLTKENLANRRRLIGKGTKKDRGLESKLHQMVSSSKLTRQQKAKVSEAAVLLRLALHGFIPYTSVFDGDATDWMVEIPKRDRVLRVEVRWARTGKYGLPVIRLDKSAGRNRTRLIRDGEVDFVAGYDLFTDTVYVFSWSELRGHRSVSVKSTAAERWDKLRG